METAIAWRRERITCDEEERLKYGYNITTHFRYDQQKRQSATVQTADDTELLRLTFGATADIWHINRGLNKKKSEERGFKLDIKTGIWGDAKNDSAILFSDLITEIICVDRQEAKGNRILED